jgi:hypothetical protein
MLRAPSNGAIQTGGRNNGSATCASCPLSSAPRSAARRTSSPGSARSCAAGNWVSLIQDDPE